MRELNVETAKEFDLPKLARHASSPTVSDATRKLFERYRDVIDAGMLNAAGQRAADFKSRCGDFLTRAIAASETSDIEAIKQEVLRHATELTRQSTRDRDIPGSHLSNLTTLMDARIRFNLACAEEEWTSIGRNLQQLEQGFAKVRHFITDELANGFLKKIRQQAGALSADEMKREFETTLDALFDDSNQDRLDELSEKIQKFNLMFGAASSSEQIGTATRWRHLAALSDAFIRSVLSVRDGQASQFIPEQWVRNNRESRQLIKPEEMIRRLKDYKVRVRGDTGETSIVRMYYDAREIMARISTLEDLSRELPDLRRSLRFLSYSGEPGSLTQALPRMQYLGGSYDMLREGDSFMLAENSYRQRDPWSLQPQQDEATESLLARLDEELFRQVLRRFVKELPADAAESPWKTMEQLMRQALERREFETVLTLHRIARHFGDASRLLPLHELDAIRHYLAGRHQEDVLEQPRLATLHYQKAAANRSATLPLDELKRRLQRLKTEHKDEYEQGTSDSLIATIGSYFPDQGPLMVPSAE